jgi:hypothetical protein
VSRRSADVRAGRSLGRAVAYSVGRAVARGGQTGGSDSDRDGRSGTEVVRSDSPDAATQRRTFLDLGRRSRSAKWRPGSPSWPAYRLRGCPRCPTRCYGLAGCSTRWHARRGRPGTSSGSHSCWTPQPPRWRSVSVRHRWTPRCTRRSPTCAPGHDGACAGRSGRHQDAGSVGDRPRPSLKSHENAERTVVDATEVRPGAAQGSVRFMADRNTNRVPVLPQAINPQFSRPCAGARLRLAGVSAGLLGARPAWPGRYWRAGWCG